MAIYRAKQEDRAPFRFFEQSRDDDQRVQVALDESRRRPEDQCRDARGRNPERGCGSGQGYLFSRAVGTEAAAQLMGARRSGCGSERAPVPVTMLPEHD